MNFLVNLCLSSKVATYLNSRGHTATRVDQLNMSQAKDREIFAYAIKHNMILLTADLDFGQILAYSRFNKSSVIVFRLKHPTPENVNKRLSNVISKFTKELKDGCIISVEDARIRVRTLPFSRS